MWACGCIPAGYKVLQNLTDMGVGLCDGKIIAMTCQMPPFVNTVILHQLVLTRQTPHYIKAAVKYAE